MRQSENIEAVRYILNRLKQHQFKAYIVGGAVRDAMLKRSPGDVDLLTNAGIQQIAGLFSDQRVKIVGKAFPICLVNGIEISSGRSNSVQSGSLGFPDSDLARRDFSFNAMACDPEKKIIIDPFSGRKDLEEGIVRFTKDPEKRIKEDPIRMIRACRFLAMIEGRLADSTFENIVTHRDLLDENIAKERIQYEIKKAMELRKPSLFFDALFKTGLLSKIFPSLDRCYDLDGGPHHGESVFEHCMLVGDALPSSMPMLRLAGYLHDTGKFDAAIIKKGQLTFAGHEKKYQHSIQDLEALRFSIKDIQYIKVLIQSHMRPLTDESTPKAVRRLLRMLEDFQLSYQDFMRMRIADKKGNRAKPPYTMSEIRVRLEKLLDQINSQNAFSIKDLKISGSDIIRILDIKPGPEVGKIKERIFQKVLDNPYLNNEESLEQICLELKIKK